MKQANKGKNKGFLDFIFSKKNKNYGAYSIRKKRASVNLLSFGLAALLVGAAYAVPFGISQMSSDKQGTQTKEEQKDKEDDQEVVTFAELSPPPPIEKPEPEEPKQEPPEKEDEPDPRQLPEAEPEEPKETTSEKLKEPEVKEDAKVTEGQGIPTQNEAKTATSDEASADQQAESESSRKVYEFAEVRPKFPGGRQEMMKYIKNNLDYPKEARDRAIEGNVVVQFVVNPSGNISNVQVVKGLGYGADKEATRLVQSMPNWQPGQQKGKKVPVKVTLPIEFNLTNI